MPKLNSSYLKQKFKSGGVSTEGYKRYSQDVNNPYNIIPSNQITMNDVDFPVLGIDDLGNQIMMQPGEDYTFPGSYVTEFPMKNMGNKRFGQFGMQKSVVLEPDYDMYKAPRQGNYLLPDINRPYYIDEAGDKRSEYRIGTNIDGRETIIPTVVGGKQLSEDEARERYYQTGLHMGMYTTPEQAEYASRLRTAKYNMLQDPTRFNASMFQMGGTMSMPGVNGQVVSSGPQPLTSVKKTRGPITKNKKGDVKTMSDQQVKQVLKYSKQKPNKI